MTTPGEPPLERLFAVLESGETFRLDRVAYNIADEVLAIGGGITPPLVAAGVRALAHVTGSGVGWRLEWVRVATLPVELPE